MLSISVLIFNPEAEIGVGTGVAEWRKDAYAAAPSCWAVSRGASIVFVLEDGEVPGGEGAMVFAVKMGSEALAATCAEKLGDSVEVVFIDGAIYDTALGLYDTAEGL